MFRESWVDAVWFVLAVGMIAIGFKLTGDKRRQAYERCQTCTTDCDDPLPPPRYYFDD